MIAGTLEIQMLANMARLQKDMDEAKRSVGGAMAEITKMVDLAKTGLVAFAGVASVGAFAGMIKGSIEAAAGMHDLSIQTGASVASLMAFKSVGATTNTSVETVAGAMNKFAKTLSVANEESKGAAQAVKAIGLDFDSLKGKKPEEQMVAVAKALNEFEDGAGKSAVAMTLFGKSGAALLPFLKDLADDSEAVTAKMSEQEQAVKKAQAAMADDFTDNLVKIKKASEAWKKDVAMAMLPALYELSQAFRDVTTGAGGVKDGISKLSKDGSISGWTRSAIFGVTYVMDAFEGLKAVIVSVGRIIGANAAMVVEAWSAAWNVVTGLFKKGNVIDDLKASMARQKEIIQSLGDDLDKTWGEKTFGAKLRDRMKEIQAVGVVSQEAKKAMNFDANGDKNVAHTAALTEQQHALKSYVEMLEKQIEKEMKLTEVEKAQIFLSSMGKTGEIAQVREMILGLAQEADAMDASNKRVAERAALRKKESDGIEEYMRNLERGYEADVKGAQDALKAAQDQYDQYGLSKSQIAELTLAKLQLRQADFNEGSAGYEAIQKQIEAQGELIGVLRKGEYRDAVNSVFASIDSTAHDVFVNIFEGGQSAFKKLGNVLKSAVLDLLYQMTVKRWILNIGASITGGLGLAGAASADTGGSALGAAASAASIFGAGGIGGALAGGAGWLTGSTTLGGALSAGASLIGTGTAAGAASGAGMIVGALAPIALGIGALVSIAKATKGETRSGGQYTYSDATGTLFKSGPSGGEISSPEVKAAITGTAQTINTLLENMGSSLTLSGFQAGLESSSKGRGGVFAGGTLSTGATFGESGKGDNYAGTLYERTSSQSPDSKTALENFTTDLVQSTIQALQAADLPNVIANMLNGIDAEALTGEAANKLLTKIDAIVTGVTGFRQALEALPFENLKGLSFDAAAGLIAAAGGMEALGSKLSTYYTNFYSAEEQRAQVVTNITNTLKEAGASLTEADVGGATREAFRAVVEATDPSSPLYVALLNVAGAFASITPAVESAASAASKLANANVGMSVGFDGKTVLGAADAAQYKIDAGFRSTIDGLQGMADRVNDWLRPAASGGYGSPEEVGARMANASAGGGGGASFDPLSDSVKQLADAQNKLTAIQTSAADALGRFTNSLLDFINELNVTDLGANSPEQRLQASRAEYERIYAEVKSGDLSESDKLVGAAKDLLTNSKAYNGSGAGFVADDAFIRATVGAVIATNQSQLNAPAWSAQSLTQYGKGAGVAELVEQIKTLNDKIAQIEKNTATQVEVSQDAGAQTVDQLKAGNNQQAQATAAMNFAGLRNV